MWILSIDPGVVNFGCLTLDTKSKSVEFNNYSLSRESETKTLISLNNILESYDIDLVVCERQTTKSNISKRIEYHYQSFYVIKGIEF